METIETLQTITRLSRDIITALRREHPGGITQNHARFLVDEYYAIQKARIRNSNYSKGLDRDAAKSGTEAEPHTAIDSFVSNYQVGEENIKKLLQWYLDEHPMLWFFENTLGIGPVLAAGLLAHIDIALCPTVGHIWSFAGLNPSVTWDKGQKRPWNTPLKTLCWKIGDSFVKLSNRGDAFYGQVYRARKQTEWQHNLAGNYRDAAKQSMATKKYGKATDQHAWYTGQCSAELAKAMLAEGKTPTVPGCKADDGFPMLSPAHIDARARRYAVKLFLSHLHECWYRQHFGEEPPKPFAISIQGHAHYIPPPQLGLMTAKAA